MLFCDRHSFLILAKLFSCQGEQFDRSGQLVKNMYDYDDFMSEDDESLPPVNFSVANKVREANPKNVIPFNIESTDYENDVPLFPSIFKDIDYSKKFGKQAQTSPLANVGSNVINGGSSFVPSSTSSDSSKAPTPELFPADNCNGQVNNINTVTSKPELSNQRSRGFQPLTDEDVIDLLSENDDDDEITIIEKCMFIFYHFYIFV